MKIISIHSSVVNLQMSPLGLMPLSTMSLRMLDLSMSQSVKLAEVL